MTGAGRNAIIGRVSTQNNVLDTTAWPDERYGEHPVTELVAYVTGGLSPYGNITFPVDASTLPYVHPHTRTNFWNE